MMAYYDRDIDRWLEGSQLAGSSAAWPLSAQSAPGAAATLTRAAEAAKRHYLQGYLVALGAADTTQAITVTLNFGSAVVWRDRFGAAAKRGERVGVMFPFPIPAAQGQAVSLEVSAGSAGVVLDVNLAGYTV